MYLYLSSSLCYRIGWCSGKSIHCCTEILWLELVLVIESFPSFLTNLLVFPGSPIYVNWRVIYKFLNHRTEYFNFSLNQIYIKNLILYYLNFWNVNWIFVDHVVSGLNQVLLFKIIFGLSSMYKVTKTTRSTRSYNLPFVYGVIILTLILLMWRI
jgi:hypothetical protein